MRYGFSRSENLEQHETEMLMQAKGQAVRSDALSCYGVQIGQRLRHVDAPASAIDESLPDGLTLEYQCDLAGIQEDDQVADKPQFCGQQKPRLLLGMTPYAPLSLCSRLEAPPRFQIVPLAARGAQTGTASGRQGRSREAGAR